MNRIINTMIRTVTPPTDNILYAEGTGEEKGEKAEGVIEAAEEGAIYCSQKRFVW